MASYKFSKDQNSRLKIRRQTEYYNKVFADWRKTHSHSVGFYPENSEANIYADIAYADMQSFSLIEKTGYEKRAEFAAFRKSLSFIGILMLLATAAIFIFQLFLPLLVGLLNPRYTYDYFGGMVYDGSGSFTLSLIIGGLGALATYTVIIAVGLKLLDIPLSIVFPTRVISHKLTVAAFPTALTLAVICIFYRHMVNVPAFMLSLNSASTAGDFISRIILYVIIIPLLSELAFRGVLLQFLRQFGDVSAVIITAALSSFTACAVMGGNMFGITTNMPITGTLAAFPISLLCAFCYGYFTISSGSVFTPIAMKMLIAIANIIHLIIYEYTPTEFSVTILLIIAIVIFIGCVIMIINVLCNNSDEIELQNNKNTLSGGDKLFCMTAPAFLLPVLLLIFTLFIPK
jgi:membrane protease YdiL (CAAX protease family)